MLSQINHWMEYAAAAFDLVLLLRILALRLQRTYVFLTLACTLAVLFDAAVLFVAPDSARVQIYVNLFLSFVFPLAAWDIFEEISAAVANLRRLAILRTIASLVIIFFVGLLWVNSLSDSNDPTNLTHLLAFTLVISTGSATGCLAFLWIMRRGLSVQKIATPRNTTVWMTFYALLMVEQLASWFVLLADDMVRQRTPDNFAPISDLVLNSYGIVITVWCAVKLRSLSKDLPSASLDANP